MPAKDSIVTAQLPALLARCDRSTATSQPVVANAVCLSREYVVKMSRPGPFAGRRGASEGAVDEFVRLFWCHGPAVHAYPSRRVGHQQADDLLEGRPAGGGPGTATVSSRPTASWATRRQTSTTSRPHTSGLHPDRHPARLAQPMTISTRRPGFAEPSATNPTSPRRRLHLRPHHLHQLQPHLEDLGQ